MLLVVRAQPAVQWTAVLNLRAVGQRNCAGRLFVFDIATINKTALDNVTK